MHHTVYLLVCSSFFNDEKLLDGNSSLLLLLAAFLWERLGENRGMGEKRRRRA
jgi:hypothetical protein